MLFSVLAAFNDILGTLGAHLSAGDCKLLFAHLGRIGFDPNR
jgi:hypothetical protein